MNNHLTIKIQYILKNSQKINSFYLTESDYFELEENEIIELDCCPKYNHAIDYIDEYLSQKEETKAEVLFTEILLTDLTKKQHRKITERYWNEGKNKIIERIDTDLAKFQLIYNELIIETLVNEIPPKWEIIRLNREEGIMQPLFHSFIEQQENGKELERENPIESLPHFKSKFKTQNSKITIKL